MVFQLYICMAARVTSGAIDDTFRHCITKMSDLHFVANKVYKKELFNLEKTLKKFMMLEV